MIGEDDWGFGLEPDRGGKCRVRRENGVTNIGRGGRCGLSEGNLWSFAECRAGSLRGIGTKMYRIGQDKDKDDPGLAGGRLSGHI